MYQQQAQTNPKIPVPAQTLQTLTQSCQYICHIILPPETEPTLQDPQTHSLMHLSQQLTKPSLTATQAQLYEQHLLQRYGDFNRICVELFYFIFACMKKNYQVVFQDDVVVWAGRAKRFGVVVKVVQMEVGDGGKEGRDREGVEGMEGEGDDGGGRFGMYQRLVRTSCQEYLEKRVVQIGNKGQLFQENRMKQKLSAMISSTIKPLKSFHTDIKTLQSQSPQSQSAQSDTTQFQTLQKSDFISTNSILSKIRNRSINMCLFRSPKPENREKLFNAIRNQKKFIREYLDAKMLFSCSQEQLGHLWRKICGNFQKYVQEGWVGNPIYIRLVQQQQQQPGMNQEKTVLVNNNHSKFIFKLKLKSQTQKPQPQSQPQPQPKPQPQSKPTTLPPPNPKQQILEYSIEYLPQKPSLIIKLHTPITLQQHNIDEQLHNWNSLIYQTSFIGLEIGEKIQSGTKVRKYVVVKAMCQFRFGDSVLCGFFKLVDVAMAGFKVVEQVLGQVGEDGMIVEDWFKDAQEVNKQIDHYSKLMGDLTRKLYDSI